RILPLLISISCLSSLSSCGRSQKTKMRGFRAVDPRTTAYLAFRIQDPKLSARVRVLDQAALNVSLDFTNYIVDPNQLVQPLLSFNLEDDEVTRAAQLVDQKMLKTLCNV
ncbi:hypothetical protein PMAYCL1PPCAC_13155, partial [Pristionchus mayeri]